MKFELVGTIADTQVIASGIGVRIRSYLRKAYGRRPLAENKGYCDDPIAKRRVTRCGVTLVLAHGIGKRDLKIKRYVSEP
jgi:hypothetical protein